MNRPRVLLADDHTLLLQGITKLLESEVELVGTVEDGNALLAAAEKLKPDVILLDISMPLLNGMGAARQVKKILPDVHQGQIQHPEKSQDGYRQDPND